MANERRSGFGFWDRLILFTAWVVTCGLVYLLGFYVGKGTQAERLGLEERIVRLPVTSSPPREGSGRRPTASSPSTTSWWRARVESDGRRSQHRPPKRPRARRMMTPPQRRPEPPSRRTAGRPRWRSPSRLPRMRPPASPCCPDPYP